MKNKRLIFLFLIIFVLSDIFGQQITGDPNIEILEELRNISSLLQSFSGEEGAPKGSLVPLTASIAKRIFKDGNDEFKKVVFYLSSDLLLTSRPGMTLKVNNNGAVEYDKGNTETKTFISNKSKGVLKEFNDKTNEESILLEFPGFDHVLLFVRNIQTNRFYFRAIDGYYSFESPSPYLCIYVYGDQIAENPQSGAGLQRDSQSRVPAGLQVTDRIPGLIMGKGTLNKDAIVSYIVSKGSVMNTQQIDALVSGYILEAQIEGVNHDIAIAQMCYATKFLNNRQLLDTYNYAGLNTDLGISERNGGRHSNMKDGIMAHIQHLKGYASTDSLKQDLVDGRYNLLKTNGYWGKVKTLESLFMVWSPSNAQNYGNEIRKILLELYRISGKTS